MRMHSIDFEQQRCEFSKPLKFAWKALLTKTKANVLYFLLLLIEKKGITWSFYVQTKWMYFYWIEWIARVVRSKCLCTTRRHTRIYYAANIFTHKIQAVKYEKKLSSEFWVKGKKLPEKNFYPYIWHKKWAKMVAVRNCYWLEWKIKAVVFSLLNSFFKLKSQWCSKNVSTHNFSNKTSENESSNMLWCRREKGEK